MLITDVELKNAVRLADRCGQFSRLKIIFIPSFLHEFNYLEWEIF